VSSASVLIGAAVALAGFSVIVLAMARRRGERLTWVALLIGVPGVYLALWAALERVSWLVIPAAVLVIGANLAPYAGRHYLRSRRSARRSSSQPDSGE
jgi:hypothetical protein